MPYLECELQSGKKQIPHPRPKNGRVLDDNVIGVVRGWDVRGVAGFGMTAYRWCAGLGRVRFAALRTRQGRRRDAKL